VERAERLVQLTLQGTDEPVGIQRLPQVGVVGLASLGEVLRQVLVWVTIAIGADDPHRLAG
jgi:hypothetical protein